MNGTFPPEISFESTNISCYGYSDGSATVIPSLGTPPYQYQWDDPGSTTDSTVTGLEANIYYHITVTDSLGWSIKDSILLSEPDPLTINPTYSDTICLYSNDGFINTDPSGGTPPYVYIWSTGATTKTLTSLEAGDYGVKVTDSHGCTDTAGFTIHPAVPYGGEQICIVTADPETGKNLVVWEKTLDVGIAYYKIYRESAVMGVYDPVGSQPFNELSVFTDTVADPEKQPYRYKITVVDTCGNESPMENSLSHKTLFLQYVSSVGGINLEWSGYEMEGEPLDFVNYTIYRGSDSTLLSPLVDVSSSINAYTDTDPTALTERYYYRVAGVFADPCVTSGDLKAGSGPYSHSMSNMEDNRIMAPVENQAPTDLALDNLTIDENLPSQALIGRFSTTDADPDDSHVYSFVSGTGDTDNGHFIITGDSLLSGQAFDYETKNTYSIRVSTTDTGDLSFEKQFAILINDVSDPAALSGSITDSSNILCHGLNDGTATVSASGGIPPYTYLWDDDATSTTATVTDLVAGHWYHVTVTDQGLQSFTDSVFLEEPDPIYISKDYTTIICKNADDGYIHLNTSGGTPPYSFNWTTGESSQEINNLAPGKFQVTITDANGCILIDSTLIDSIVPYQDEEICMVTINPHNQIIIIWEKTYGKGTAWYNIYRRQSGNTYARIDSVLFDSLSIYTDKSSLPQEQSFYYKISAVDSCGQESVLSPYHKSIHMWTAVGVNGEVTLNWNNYEGYEYSDFEIFRGTDYMQLSSVRTIISDARSWTDPDIPAGRVYYQVSAVKSSPCFPTKFKSDPVFESAMSNIDDNGATGVYDHNLTENLMIYPNPFNEITTLTFNNPAGYPYTLFITDLSGKVIRIVDNIYTSIYVLEKGDLKEGFYFVELRGPNIYRGKIVIE